MMDAPIVPVKAEPPMDDDTEEDKYFQPAPAFKYTVRPKPMGVQSGLIPDANLKASSSKPTNQPVKARPMSASSWQPSPVDGNPYLEVDLGIKSSVHGIGTLGDPDRTKTCWVTKYLVKTSLDGTTWTTLKDKNNTAQDRAFEGNNDRNTWKRHCLHRYYGNPITARYVRFYPLQNTGCTGMRVEVYGFRDSNDPL